MTRCEATRRLPVPNDFGVFQKSDAEAFSLCEHATIYVLEVGEREWIAAFDVSMPGGSYTQPLSTNSVRLPDREAALCWAVLHVLDYNCSALEAATALRATQRELAALEQLEKAAVTFFRGRGSA